MEVGTLSPVRHEIECDCSKHALALGGGPLGHPKIFINLDKPGPKACGYW